MFAYMQNDRYVYFDTPIHPKWHIEGGLISYELDIMTC